MLSFLIIKITNKIFDELWKYTKKKLYIRKDEKL
jgi:hypothetical protein